MKKIITPLLLMISSSAFALDKVATIDVSNGNTHTVMHYGLTYSDSEQRFAILEKSGGIIVDGVDGIISPILKDSKTIKINYALYDKNNDVNERQGIMSILVSDFLDGKKTCSPVSESFLDFPSTGYRLCISRDLQSNDNLKKVN